MFEKTRALDVFHILRFDRLYSRAGSNFTSDFLKVAHSVIKEALDTANYCLQFQMIQIQDLCLGVLFGLQLDFHA